MNIEDTETTDKKYTLRSKKQKNKGIETKQDAAVIETEVNANEPEERPEDQILVSIYSHRDEAGSLIKVRSGARSVTFCEKPVQIGVAAPRTFSRNYLKSNQKKKKAIHSDGLYMLMNNPEVLQRLDNADGALKSLSKPNKEKVPSDPENGSTPVVPIINVQEQIKVNYYRPPMAGTCLPTPQKDGSEGESNSEDSSEENVYVVGQSERDEEVLNILSNGLDDDEEEDNAFFTDLLKETNIDEEIFNDKMAQVIEKASPKKFRETSLCEDISVTLDEKEASSESSSGSVDSGIHEAGTDSPVEENTPASVAIPTQVLPTLPMEEEQPLEVDDDYGSTSEESETSSISSDDPRPPSPTGHEMTYLQYDEEPMLPKYKREVPVDKIKSEDYMEPPLDRSPRRSPTPRDVFFRGPDYIPENRFNTPTPDISIPQVSLENIFKGPARNQYVNDPSDKLVQNVEEMSPWQIVLKERREKEEQKVIELRRQQEIEEQRLKAIQKQQQIEHQKLLEIQRQQEHQKQLELQRHQEIQKQMEIQQIQELQRQQEIKRQIEAKREQEYQRDQELKHQQALQHQQEILKKLELQQQEELLNQKEQAIIRHQELEEQRMRDLALQMQKDKQLELQRMQEIERQLKLEEAQKHELDKQRQADLLRQIEVEKERQIGLQRREKKKESELRAQTGALQQDFEDIDNLLMGLMELDPVIHQQQQQRRLKQIEDEHRRSKVLEEEEMRLRLEEEARRQELENARFKAQHHGHAQKSQQDEEKTKQAEIDAKRERKRRMREMTLDDVLKLQKPKKSSPTLSIRSNSYSGTLNNKKSSSESLNSFTNTTGTDSTGGNQMIAPLSMLHEIINPNVTIYEDPADSLIQDTTSSSDAPSEPRRLPVIVDNELIPTPRATSPPIPSPRVPPRTDIPQPTIPINRVPSPSNFTSSQIYPISTQVYPITTPSQVSYAAPNAGQTFTTQSDGVPPLVLRRDPLHGKPRAEPANVHSTLEPYIMHATIAPFGGTTEPDSGKELSPNTIQAQQTEQWLDIDDILADVRMLVTSKPNSSHSSPVIPPPLSPRSTSTSSSSEVFENIPPRLPPKQPPIPPRNRSMSPIPPVSPLLTPPRSPNLPTKSSISTSITPPRSPMQTSPLVPPRTDRPEVPETTKRSAFQDYPGSLNPHESVRRRNSIDDLNRRTHQLSLQRNYQGVTNSFRPTTNHHSPDYGDQGYDPDESNVTVPYYQPQRMYQRYASQSPPVPQQHSLPHNPRYPPAPQQHLPHNPTYPPASQRYRTSPHPPSNYQPQGQYQLQGQYQPQSQYQPHGHSTGQYQPRSPPGPPNSDKILNSRHHTVV